MTDRRSFVAGMLAAGLAPGSGWAEVGTPAFLSAGKAANGAHVLCGLTGLGKITFTRPLPARGHAAAAHPVRAEAVAFARRPGTFAIVLDCTNGALLTRLDIPEGRHFYGHGSFSGDGAFLFTSENDYDRARGVVGVWDARRNYKRLGEFPSGGIGPHDIKRIPGRDILVVANGGIETHPDTGRTKLNLPQMRSNLTFLDLDGHILDQVELSTAHQRNSIRHLAVAQDGTVAFAMQWQGDLRADLPLLGTHELSTSRTVLYDAVSVDRMAGYLGSVALTPDGQSMAVTSPRAGAILVLSREMPGTPRKFLIKDVCGVAATAEGIVATSGTGGVHKPNAQIVTTPVRWDNHLVQTDHFSSIAS